MTSWVTIALKRVFKSVIVLLVCLAVIIVIVYGPRIYRIANPALNHTLFWVSSSESRLATRIHNGEDVNKANHEGFTPLHLAAQFGEPKNLSLLINAGADVLARNQLGQSVLYQAVSGGPAENIRILLRNGANVNVGDHFQVSPLHRAVSLGESGASKGQNVVLLLAAGADIDARTDKGDSPVHWAATSYYLDWALLPILKAGGNPNGVNNQGKSPLHTASSMGDEAAVLMLLAYGADPSIRDQEGKTAFVYAGDRPQPFTEKTMSLLEKNAHIQSKGRQ